MKLLYIGTASAILCFSFASCDRHEERYLNLATGEPVELQKDENTGAMVDAETGRTVAIYVDTKKHDTIEASTGRVINGWVFQTADGSWKIKEDGEEYKAKSGNAKYKTEDGDLKIKDGNYTRKVDEDGDIKIEDGKKQIKIDGETGEVKVKKDRNLTEKVKKVFN